MVRTPTEYVFTCDLSRYFNDYLRGLCPFLLLEYDELVGEAVVVNINGNLVCKEYNIAEDGHLWLKSRNRNKANEDRNIYDLDGVKIIGRVVKVIGL